MTLQIARMLLASGQISEALLVAGSRSLPASLLDELGEQNAELPGMRCSRVRALPAQLHRLPGLPALRRALLQRRQTRAIAELTARAGGRLVYHEPNMIARPFDGTTVITINDLSWRLHPEMHPADRVKWIERRLPQSLRQADRIITISEFTAQEAVAHLGIARERITVAPLAPSAVFRPIVGEQAMPALQRWGLADREFILSVSTLEPRKNFDGLLTAYLRLPERLRARIPLVVSGGSGWGKILTSQLAERARASGELRLLGHVEDEALAALYSRCTAFAFPSFYEGFGLPVIEAMACGAPVIAAGTTAVGETAGDAALLIDPAEPAAIEEALRRVIEDDAAANALRERGLARAAQFTWDATFDRVVGAWRQALVENGL
ncbi:MAG: glycosyltransferase family 4 protein [Acetobacteraceae bacterium]|nr:glycosyltransferase family 4 protein [Acetobacteraceae bacterium]